MTPELKKSRELVGVLSGMNYSLGRCTQRVELLRIDAFASYATFWFCLAVTIALLLAGAEVGALILSVSTGTYLYRGHRDRKDLLSWSRKKGQVRARRDKMLATVAVDLETKISPIST